jgi:hypothetical protein
LTALRTAHTCSCPRVHRSAYSSIAANTKATQGDFGVEPVALRCFFSPLHSKGTSSDHAAWRQGSASLSTPAAASSAQARGAWTREFTAAASFACQLMAWLNQCSKCAFGHSTLACSTPCLRQLHNPRRLSSTASRDWHLYVHFAELKGCEPLAGAHSCACCASRSTTCARVWDTVAAAGLSQRTLDEHL